MNGGKQGARSLFIGHPEKEGEATTVLGEDAQPRHRAYA